MIEQLLIKSEIRYAITALLDLDGKTQAGLRLDIIQQSGNFEDAQKSFLDGVSSNEERNRVVARVRMALLELLKTIPERLTTPEQIQALKAFQFELPEQVKSRLQETAPNTPIEKAPVVEKEQAVAPRLVAAIPKFVIVYDLADSNQAQMLNRHLNVLKFTKKIRVYNVQDAVGELVASAEQEMADADYLLVLVTVNIFNSPQWFDLVSQALAQGRRVIPILVEKADYVGTGLEELRSLPSQGRAVSDFANSDAAYADIVSDLRKLLPK